MSNLGQIATAMGRARSKVAKNAVLDNHPIFAVMKKHGGIVYKDGGRDIVEEAATAQNSTVKFMGEKSQVSLADTDILDAANYDWMYMGGAVTQTRAEALKNRGVGKYLDLLALKYTVLEDSLMNLLHAALTLDGTTALYPNGLSNLVATTTTSGVVGGLNRATAGNEWIRNQSATTTTAVASATMDASNAKACADYAIDRTVRMMKTGVQCAIAGATHWAAFTQAFSAHQQIQNVSGTGKLGFDRIVYRGVEIYNGGGISYSALDQVSATRTYFLNVKPGGVNLVYMRGAEFDLLPQTQSADQAAISRMMFTMMNFIIGGLAKFNFVIYNG